MGFADSAIVASRNNRRLQRMRERPYRDPERLQRETSGFDLGPGTAEAPERPRRFVARPHRRVGALLLSLGAMAAGLLVLARLVMAR